MPRYQRGYLGDGDFLSATIDYPPPSFTRWHDRAWSALSPSHLIGSRRRCNERWDRVSTHIPLTSDEPPAKRILGGNPGAAAQASTAEDPTMTAAATPAFRTVWPPASHPAGINVFGGDSVARWTGGQPGDAKTLG
ncbi:uncharacterized protein PAN0_002d1051 [Moesziomyces antarcticus]|uniref:uncharacterized protein n=1 Tax=Pseudozyma antarctica TaxID=84753 RepID=UPI0007196AA5|nr:uncharacterized protein PAN0_002d1051 [Moesziomyces antarcticus]GAK62849.1 hypothetical protein PAN0_002d1051 [Moesziomyces antarcticus]